MVNTFMLSSDYRVTAKLLDRKRLGKQRVEAKQIIDALSSMYILQGNEWISNPNPKGWINHPCSKMWMGYVPSLMVYFNIITQEWVDRGYKNNMEFYKLDLPRVEIQPPWTYWKEVHYSHMASLMRKDTRLYYDKLTYPYIYNLYGYLWPNKLADELKTKLTNNESVDLSLICDPISTSVTDAEARRREADKTFYYEVCMTQYTRDYK